MGASTFIALALACSPQVHPATAGALVSVESSFNPWAIGVVGGRLERQPRHRAEALATARSLRAAGWNFSVGLGQINVGNFERLGLTEESAFEPCRNLTAMQTLLAECLDRTHTGRASPQNDQTALRQALSCYYSGDLVAGFRHSYVQRVIAAAAATRYDVSTVQPKEKS